MAPKQKQQEIRIINLKLRLNNASTMADSGIDLFQLSQHEINRAKINIFRIPGIKNTAFAWNVKHDIYVWYFQEVMCLSLGQIGQHLSQNFTFFLVAEGRIGTQYFVRVGSNKGGQANNNNHPKFQVHLGVMINFEKKRGFIGRRYLNFNRSST